MPLFSIITVVYNGKHEIKKTIESVLTQNCTDYELLVIDGASSDGTPQAAMQYADVFQKKGIGFTVVSEPDEGIYDAMNKGIRKSCGEWLYFLNAGDCLYDAGVLRRVADKVQGDCGTAGIVYGDIYSERGEKGCVMKSKPNVDEMERNIPFCHQAVFVRGELHRRHLYNTSYRLAADYDFFLGEYRNGTHFQYMDVVVARFDLDGASNNNRKQLFLEYHTIYQKYGLESVPRYLAGYVRMLAAGLMPKRLVDKIMRKRVQ